jgi:hypothetical protein
MSGAAPNTVRQARSLRITTLPLPGSSSFWSNSRPRGRWCSQCENLAAHARNPGLIRSSLDTNSVVPLSLLPAAPNSASILIGISFFDSRPTVSMRLTTSEWQWPVGFLTFGAPSDHRRHTGPLRRLLAEGRRFGTLVSEFRHDDSQLLFKPLGHQAPMAPYVERLPTE